MPAIERHATIDVMAEIGGGEGPERYSPRQVRLIRRFVALVGQNETKVLGALEVLVGKMLVEASQQPAEG